MHQPQITIVVTPRERFSYTERSLENIYENTDFPFKLIYVDGNSPPAIQHYLEAQAKQKGFELMRTDYFLSPNQARNLALRNVNTKYVVFIDNDVLVTPSWLGNLFHCAEETKAWVVGPIYLIGMPEDKIIHMAGGLAHFQYRGSKRIFIEKHCFVKRHLDKVRSKLKREPTELVEFHCMLVKTEIFEQLGALDEKLMSAAEHTDLCLAVREAGGTVYLEPSAVVTYVPPPPFASTDLPYFLLRWSDAWNRASLNHFREKWHLAEDDPFITSHYKWLHHHQQLAVSSSLRRLFPVGHDSRINRYILMPLENTLNHFSREETDA